MLISWNKKFETGIEEIDRQHKNLFAIAERLYEAKKGDGENLGLRIDKTAEELLEYTEIHFKTEESLMEKCNYAGLSEHKRIHSKFKETAIEYKIRIKERRGDLFLAMEMMNFLIDWIVVHVSVTDKEYVPYLKASGQK
jgi:hemerythrin